MQSYLNHKPTQINFDPNLRRPISWVTVLLVATLVFALALLLRGWFNFVDIHVSCAGSCDASEYLRDAANISRVSIQLGSIPIRDYMATVVGLAPYSVRASVQAVFDPLKEMSIAGPIFPLFL